MKRTTIAKVTGVPVMGGSAACAAGGRQVVHIKRWAALYALCQGRAYE